MLGKIVSACLEVLKERKIPANKTIVQKIVYFTLEKKEREEFFSPFVTGPFSDDVQIYLFSPPLDEKLRKDKIQKVIEILQKYKLTDTEKIQKISKIHYLIYQKGIKKEEIKRRGRLIFPEVNYWSNTEISFLTRVSKELENLENSPGSRRKCHED